MPRSRPTPPPATTPDPLLHAFGMEVHRRREALGWSFDAMAEQSGLSRSMLIGIEHGRRNPSLKVIVAIADALGCAPGELLST